MNLYQLRLIANSKPGLIAYLESLDPATTFDPTEPTACPVHDYLSSCYPGQSFSITCDSIGDREIFSRTLIRLTDDDYARRVQLAFFDVEARETRKDNHLTVAEAIVAAKETPA